ncbi:hypothetical protein AAHC03_0369 [Spirometra sp. Aus1]
MRPSRIVLRATGSVRLLSPPPADAAASADVSLWPILAARADNVTGDDQGGAGPATNRLRAMVLARHLATPVRGKEAVRGAPPHTEGLYGDIVNGMQIRRRPFAFQSCQLLGSFPPQR